MKHSTIRFLPRTIGLRWIAAALVLVIVAPVGVLAGLMVQRGWRRQRATVDNQNIATARAISVAVDQYVEKTTAALDVLGELHALDAPDLDAFESLAGRILPYQPSWSAIILADPRGKILHGTPDTLDGNPTDGIADWAITTADARKVTVTPLFTLPNAGYFVIIATPVFRHGAVVSVLGARVRSAGLSALLKQQQAPTSATVALIDSRNHVMARTLDEKNFVGTPTSQAFVDERSRASEGAWRAILRDGRPSYAAFCTSSTSGLTVSVALPTEVVDGPIRRILWTFGGALAVVVTLGAALGLLLGQVIVRALATASNAAMALVRGQDVAPVVSRIAEINELGDSLRRAAETLEARNRERNEASRLKDEFLMTISHELRTPLTAVCGWARMLSSGQVRDEQRPRAIDAIQRNAYALQQLVDDLLDVSRIVTGKLRLEVTPVSLGDVVVAAVEGVRPAAGAKNIQIVTDRGEDMLTISADLGRLQQVLWNLLSNAVKFTPNGGRIDISCHRVGDNIELSVRDTGVGIEPDFLPHVFERFRQGKGGPTRAHGGLGLGLSIVRHLVELHGGTVAAENNVPPPGATFHLVLPALVMPTYSGSGGQEWNASTTPGATTTTPTTAAG